MPAGTDFDLNSVIWVYDHRGQTEGAALGWTRLLPPTSITSICSMSAVDDTGDLLFGGEDGQLYVHEGSGDIDKVALVIDASNTSPIIVTTAAAHELDDHDFVFIRGVVGNAAANGNFYVHASGFDPNQFALYSDHDLSVAVGGSGVASYSNLHIDGSDSTKVTTASHAFVTADVGKSLSIQAGSGFTACTPTIVGVESGAARLSIAIGTPGSTAGNSQSAGCVGRLDTVPFTVKSRGMAKEETGQTWFETNRPTRVLAKLKTSEATLITLTCSTDEGAAASTVTHTVPAGVVQLRDKVSAGVRGDSIFVTLSGSTVSPTKVTSLAVEASEGSIRGNA
jgi:hypothetical protein